MHHFDVKFQKQNSNHWVRVLVHKNRGQLRSYARRYLRHDASKSDALCSQWDHTAQDNRVADIHLSGDKYLTLNAVVHECAHASVHRTRILGIPFESPAFEEWVSTGVGCLVEQIARELHRLGFSLEI